MNPSTRETLSCKTTQKINLMINKGHLKRIKEHRSQKARAYKWVGENSDPKVSHIDDFFMDDEGFDDVSASGDGLFG
jgi:hypothetical protein